MSLQETQRPRRGHDFLPPADVLAQIPKLYGTEKVDTNDKIVWVHYFCAAGDWYVTELNEDQELAFGFCQMQDSAWGYVSLEELETLNVHGGLVIVERDVHWTPKKFSELNLR